MALSGDFFTDLGGGISSLFGAAGDISEAKAYTQAATYAKQNEAITAASTRLQEAQASRKIFQTLGAQSAQVASAGFAASGSSLDLARSSIQQGSVQKQLIADQGLINENGFAEEASHYEGMASAAKKAAGGGILGGILKIAGAVAPFI